MTASLFTIGVVMSGIWPSIDFFSFFASFFFFFDIYDLDTWWLTRTFLIV